MSDGQFLFTDTKLVSVTSLKSYDRNPRKGNVRAIAESLAANKQYRPIVVQKSTKKILAGNHTWQAAKILGWDKIAVVFVDVDDEQAKRIVLADNRTNDLAEYDNGILAELLKDLGSTAGTGYTESDLQSILAALEGATEAVYSMSDTVHEESLLHNDRLVDLPVGPLATRQQDDDADSAAAFGQVEEEEDKLDKTEGDLAGVFTLKDDLVFPGYGFWEIPYLRDDMMIEELPSPLTTWAGSATRDMDWEGYWLYNWGIDSTSGMKDLSKIMLSFYAWDEYFECWWDNPSKYLSKVINAKIKYAITPNYTQGGMPMALSLHNLYRSRWVGRYLQEVGVRVMPDLEMRDEPQFADIAIKSLPKRVPWASIQVQNLDAKTRGGKGEDPALRAEWLKGLYALLSKANIENLLIYCAPTKNDEVASWLEKTGVGMHFMPTRLHLLSKRVRSNEKAADRL